MFNKTTDRATLTREICDLAQRYGERVETPDTIKAEIFDLRGVVRVSVETEGLRRHFEIQSGAMRIQTSTYRGQMEAIQVTNGDKATIDHIAFHARIAGGMVLNERNEAERRARKQEQPAPRM